MKMKHLYVIVEEENRNIKIMWANTLSNYLQKLNLLDRDNPKLFTEFDGLMQTISQKSGIPIIKYSDFINNEEIVYNLIFTVFKGKGYKFNSMQEVINFCRTNKLSAAKDGVITSTINRNLNGTTKSAYGLNWESKEVVLDIEKYQVEYVI